MSKIAEILNDRSKKKKLSLILLALLVLLIIIFIISSIITANKNSKCNDLKNEIIALADDYLEEIGFPSLNGTSITVDLNDLDEVIYKNKSVKGTITYTKYNDTYVKTFNITNASHCDTKKFGKQTSEYKENKNAEVTVTYNYYEVSSYDSKWTNYMASEYISDTETNGVLLPLNSKNLPTIPDNAVITEYVRETKTYYSYRDAKWKWYKNYIKYSDYSSEQPKGYPNKDTSTHSTTKQSEWSLDYPEVFDYRHIKTTTGYRWYYLDGKEKVYFENGKYSPTAPGDNYQKDKDTKVTMYSYYDDQWRWYNGDTKRVYSSYQSLKPSGYNYKDEDTLTYTNWSSYKPESTLNSSNESYREERMDTYSRYKIKYDIYSLPMLKENVSLEELENILGKSYEELVQDKTIKIEPSFKFSYE